MSTDDLAAQGYSVRRDDYSLQVSSPTDRLFWIRIDTSVDALEISDLNPGGASPDQVARVLLLSIERAGFDKITALTIRDIAPAGVLDERVSQLSGIIASLATQARLTVIDEAIAGRRNKYDFTAFFGPLDQHR